MSAQVVVFNKRASFLYHIKEKFEAGLVLMGSEVKSLRSGRCQLKDSYVSFRHNEAYLQKAHISPYDAAGEAGHKPERLRKILLNRKEINRIQGIIQQKKHTCIPLRIYFKRGKIKVEIALAIGKTHGDKRESKKKKEDMRKISRALSKRK